MEYCVSTTYKGAPNGTHEKRIMKLVKKHGIENWHNGAMLGSNERDMSMYPESKDIAENLKRDLENLGYLAELNEIEDEVDPFTPEEHKLLETQYCVKNDKKKFFLTHAEAHSYVRMCGGTLFCPLSHDIKETLAISRKKK